MTAFFFAELLLLVAHLQLRHRHVDRLLDRLFAGVDEQRLAFLVEVRVGADLGRDLRFAVAAEREHLVGDAVAEHRELDAAHELAVLLARRRRLDLLRDGHDAQRQLERLDVALDERVVERLGIVAAAGRGRRRRQLGAMASSP